MNVGERVGQRRFRDAGQEAMISLLVAAGHLGGRLEEVCAREGITRDQYNVLRILRGVHPEGHPRYEIGRRLIDRAPDVTRLLDRLERRGLVKRTRADGDRRLSVARITRAGLALLDRLDGPVDQVHTEFSAPLPAQELERLARLCGRLISGVAEGE